MTDTTSYSAYRDMQLWQRAVELAAEISVFSAQLPNATSTTAVTTLQEAALAIPTLLARGSRSSKRGLRDNCLIARQTILEIESLLYIVNQIYSSTDLQPFLERTEELYNGLTIMAHRLGESAKASV